jgi:hypothetical protein
MTASAVRVKRTWGLILPSIGLSCAALAAALPNLNASAKFNRGSIVIANLNDYGWADCSVDVNPDDPQWWFAALHIDVRAHEATVLEANRFKTPQGDATWNPRTRPPMTLRIVCTIPDGSRSVAVVAVE